MERLDWRKIIKPNIFFLNILGLWPSDNAFYGFNVYTLWTFICLVLFQGGHIFFQTVNIFFILDNLQAVTGIIFILLTEVQGVLKAYCLITNTKMLKQLMITINSDSFQPKNLEQRDIIKPNFKSWNLIYWIFVGFDGICLVFMLSFPILDKSYKDYRLPASAWYPYNEKTSPLYELTYLYQALSINFVNLVNMNIDALIAALNMYIGALFDILCDDVRNLDDVRVNQKLKRCIQRHREILKFADDVNDFYSWLIFVEFFSSAISIGLSMFQLTLVVPFSVEFFMFLTYGHAILAEMFFYCWFGNEVELKSMKLPFAIFESDWTGFPPEIKKSIIIFMIKAQRPVKISAFGLFYLSLETFVKILRTAWSYFALLRTVNS